MTGWSWLAGARRHSGSSLRDSTRDWGFAAVRTDRPVVMGLQEGLASRCNWGRRSRWLHLLELVVMMSFRTKSRVCTIQFKIDRVTNLVFLRRSLPAVGLLLLDFYCRLFLELLRVIGFVIAELAETLLVLHPAVTLMDSIFVQASHKAITLIICWSFVNVFIDRTQWVTFYLVHHGQERVSHRTKYISVFVFV